MNKDVLYIEPEDDITDIITKIEHTPEKIAVLVPPKKASDFRSAVNIKLIAKTAASVGKTPVIVTVDPSIIKLAAASNVLVTKDLKTPPSVPEVTSLSVDDESEVIEDYEAADEESTSDEPVENSRAEAKVHYHERDIDVEGDAEEVQELEDEDKAGEDEPDDKKGKKDKKEPENKVAAWFYRHKIVLIIGAVATCGIIGFLVWAFKFAPAVAISVEVQTERKNFAENVLFTPDPLNENAAEGEFYIQEFRTEQAQEIKFDATGTKNLGEKASGTINVYANFNEPGSVVVPVGATFTDNGLTFSVTKGVTLSYSGKLSECHALSSTSCKRSGTVNVVADGNGTKYNVGNDPDLSTNSGVLVESSAIGGGTDKEVPIVEQIDVERAKDQTKEENISTLKERLVSNIPQNMVVIDASFAADTSSADISPGVGEEVPEGTTPTLKIVTSASIYAIDRSKLEQFIRETAQLEDSQRIYELEDPSIESFVNDGSIYTGRLRTNYYVGPKITESEVVDLAKGKGFGDIQRTLRDMPGVINVTLDPSYPWVSVAPDDTNKISVSVNIKGQNQGQNQANNENQEENQDNNNQQEEQE